MYRWASGHDQGDPARWRPAIMVTDFAGVAGLIGSVGAATAAERLMPLLDRLVTLVRAHKGSILCIVDGLAVSAFGLDSTDGHELTRAIRTGRAFLAAVAAH